MKSDPMEMMIGVSDAVRGDTEAANRHCSAAAIAQENGDHEGAIAEFRKAVAADPANQDALFRLAYALDLLGEEDEAISLYERCTKIQPAPINALINLAVLYEDIENYAGAEKCLRQVLDTMPNHERARLFMKDVQASREMYYDEDHERELHKRSALLDTPVTDFELSVRARNCLKKMNIRTLGDLLRITEAELLAYQNFGETSLVEIKHMLSQKGLKLGQRADDTRREVSREVYDKAARAGVQGDLNRPVGDLNLSVRARKALQMLGIQTIGELASRTEAELMGVKNFGHTSLVEIKERLGALGLSLRELEF
ncbi:MAG: tetratricopeptide repeat protein [Phycisphaeraceae bacterium]|nr:tetratricopeptide repeat protein [Phycisphaeraceae bacterium]